MPFGHSSLLMTSPKITKAGAQQRSCAYAMDFLRHSSSCFALGPRRESAVATISNTSSRRNKLSCNHFSPRRRNRQITGDWEFPQTGEPHLRLCAAAAASKRGRSPAGGPPSTKGHQGGFGAKAASKSSFDAGVLLRRSELLYSQLLVEHAAEGDVREFVVCVREKKSAAYKSRLDDWLPVAELALVSPQDASEALPVLLPTVCREIAECAAKGAVALRSISRSGLEYAYEPADAFYEHVMSGSNVKLSSAECPYGILGLQKGAPASEVRTAYRSLAAKSHPDRQLNADLRVAEMEFKRITDAYDQIKRAGLASGGGGSYAALGGNARNGLSDPIVVSSSKMASGLPDGVKLAVRQLDPDIVSLFLTRLYLRSGGGATIVV